MNRPKMVGEKEYQKIKRDSMALFVNANNLVYKYLGLLKDNLSICLFSPEGCLLRVYSTEHCSDEWNRKHFLVSRTMWCDRSIPRNPITEGLINWHPSYSVGQENEFAPFQDAFVCFHPCIQTTRRDEEFGHCGRCGAIALVGPVEKWYEGIISSVTIIAATIAREWESKIWMINTFDKMCDGVFIVEYYRDELQLSSCSDRLSQYFGLHDIAAYEPIHNIFDPLPANKELWRIISQKKAVEEMDTTLSVRGKRFNVNIRADITPAHDNDSVIFAFFVLSRKKIVGQVTKYMGYYAKATFDDIIGESDAIRNAISLASAVSGYDMNILLLGESGVGKDLFAQSIHNASKVKNGPFVTINCASIPRDLLASELFGYEKGAFTGAKKNGQMGKFELANGGTLFLDEIGDLPLDLQTLLLRVLEEKCITRLGSNEKISLNVRVIAATNVDLRKKIEEKQFREDLFYRLNRFCVNIPPLRERGDDIKLLLKYFYEQASLSFHKVKYSISEEILEYLGMLPWYGNVREVQSFVEMIACVNPCNITSLNQLPHNILNVNNKEPDTFKTGIINVAPAPEKVRHTIEDILSKDKLEQALIATRYNKVKTAKMLGISRSSLYKLLRAYNIES